MANNNELCIVIPTYNPQRILLTICTQIADMGYQLIIVDDGSNEKSEPIFDLLSAQSIDLVRIHENIGQGGAIEQGIKHGLRGTAQFFMTFDSDGQHPIDSISELLATIKSSNNDIVLGSRFLRKEDRAGMPLTKKLVLRLGVLFNYIISGMRLTDAHNGMRIFTRKVAETIEFKEKRMAHASEILWIIKRNNFSYTEHPIKVTYDIDGPSQKASNAVGIGLRLLRRILLNAINSPN